MLTFTFERIVVQSQKFIRGYAAIGLFNPKTSLNVGSVLRAAGCYGASMVAIQGRRFESVMTDPASSHLHLPVIETPDLMSVIPHGCVPVAVEFIESATSLVNYVHPERAFYILGPEDGSVSKELVARCRDVVYVPTNQCMNLAATANVLLYDRLSKQLRR